MCRTPRMRAELRELQPGADDFTLYGGGPLMRCACSLLSMISSASALNCKEASAGDHTICWTQFVRNRAAAAGHGADADGVSASAGYGCLPAAPSSGGGQHCAHVNVAVVPMPMYVSMA